MPLSNSKTALYLGLRSKMSKNRSDTNLTNRKHTYNTYVREEDFLSFYSPFRWGAYMCLLDNPSITLHDMAMPPSSHPPTSAPYPVSKIIPESFDKVSSLFLQSFTGCSRLFQYCFNGGLKSVKKFNVCPPDFLRDLIHGLFYP